jgi:hypothetical protein
MRSVVAIIFLAMFGLVPLWSQTSFNRSWKQKTPEFHFWIPKTSMNYYYLDRNETVIDKYSLMVYKSPIRHTAFFCNLETKSQKKLGIMFQFHVGNYQSYMDYKIPY